MCRTRIASLLVLLLIVSGCRSFVVVELEGQDTLAYPRETVRITTKDHEVVEGRLLALGETELGLPSGRVAYEDIRQIEVYRRNYFGRAVIGTRNLILVVGLLILLNPFD